MHSAKYILQDMSSTFQYIKLSSKDRMIIHQNSKFRNTHKGHRCFVLGNGPSLNECDLSLLNKEFVFCVNEFVKYDKVKIVKPNYYVLADPKFFDMDPNDEGDKYLINQFQKMFEDISEVELFIPIFAKNVMTRYSWKAKINYFFAQKPFDPKFYKSYDYSACIPGMQAVVQYAILLAIFMGFSEIYLLGTEQTNIFGNIKAYMKSDEVSDYAFVMNEQEKRWKNKKLTSYTLPETLRGYARIFELYEQLGEYCKNLNVELKNCSPNSLIQGIDKIEFNSLFNIQI